MRILVVGSGGREHALVWKIAQSKLVDKIFAAPGNGGIAQQAECLDIKADDCPELLNFARKEKIDLTVVGPEIPLAAGIVDEFRNHKLKIFGPEKKGAQLEASKVFAKQLMAKYAVPTADFKIFEDAREANKYLDLHPAPCVVKAEGLAAGKGVIVAKTNSQAKEAVRSIIEEKKFKDAGRRIVIEECLFGDEASILVFTDSKDIIPLVCSQDHKRIFDHDQGPNTGGMGAYAPAPVVNQKVFGKVLNDVIYRMIDGLAKEGIDYQGVLYAGIMITEQGPKVLEFNVRFGDPETQAILPLLQSDLVEVMLATVEGKLGKMNQAGALNWDRRACVCVVCSSGGYPGDYEKNKEISGLDRVAKMEDIAVFHAGTKSEGSEKRFLTNGGRVLGVSGLGDTINQAINKTYQAVGQIHFEKMHYRKDIAAKAINREE